MSGTGSLYRLVVLGDGSVGKTALTLQFTLSHFVDTYDPTIEDSYRKQVVVDDVPCIVEVLDTAGQDEYISLRDQWIRDGEAFLLVYSITSRSTFEHVDKFHHQCQRVKDSDKTPILIVGNKNDLTLERQVTRDEGTLLAKKLRCEFVETSAKTASNVEKAFFCLIRMMRAQREEEVMLHFLTFAHELICITAVLITVISFYHE
ncbi:hypothetical protein SeMB42_g02329 [Synchytrium endobioticum]|uniref:Small monomeric GTPase n=1 Tax=Synchytrium endobioticum TaxID=286115 RepID=A0A507D5S0_9FUNG|nr:hypothetical protein SeLEV6574_g03119 [Synchytrium endobioticum]TPX50236.1 hypothetical protein SeMB42_g02329 [Synchytrium endobioticum]